MQQSGWAAPDEDAVVIGPLMAGTAPLFSRRSMALCAVGGELVFFGGVGAGGTESILDVSNDCWVFDPTRLNWRQVAPSDPWPSPRRCVGITATPTGMFVWGGSGVIETSSGRRYDFLNDWWQFDRASERWSQLRETDDHLASPISGTERSYPSPRYTPVLLSFGEELFLFGGYTEDRLGKRKMEDAWVGRDGRWQLVEASGPAGYAGDVVRPGPRYGCMSAAAERTAFVFGGFSDAGDHNDLWQFDLSNRQWTLIVPESSSAAVPAPRYCGAFVRYDRRLYLFGGRSRKNPKANFNDLWTFDLDTRRWECAGPNRSPHRYDAGAEYPAYHAKSSTAVIGRHWYLWGGEGVHGHVSDFWRFSFEAHAWHLVQAARHDDPVFW